ncbi:ATP-binding cassette domain-containing protein [Helicobacter burdigaliensis]|uniref:ATP-binding cassette domain-containing protein n=1 Tax=Helicobacter burdigaliensis TaxID=2315334 RepID=UPI000EF64644|nr:ATP-binding cassette domain-containing protein [Helicobacter burdigaliensis]
MLEVKNLSKSYIQKKHWYLKNEENFIFKNLNFHLKKGENLLICGESGSGKSTLAKILCMLESPKEGQVFFEKEDILVLDFKAKRLLRKKIQYIFQDQKLALNPYKNAKTLLLDVYKNFHLKPDFKEIFALLEMFGLKEEILCLKPQNLSGGQCQRLGLIRSLLLKPKLLILDEVFAPLDLPIALKIIDYLKTFQKNNDITYIFISHQEKLLKDFYTQKLQMPSKNFS